MSFARNTVPPTVVVRSPKTRPSVQNSLDKGHLELTPEVSPSTSGEACQNSGGIKDVPPRTNSTGMTSLDSKFSAGIKMLSGHSSGNNQKMGLGVDGKLAKALQAEETVVQNGLTPIMERAQEVVIEPVPVPSKSTPLSPSFPVQCRPNADDN